VFPYWVVFLWCLLVRCLVRGGEVCLVFFMRVVFELLLVSCGVEV